MNIKEIGEVIRTRRKYLGLLQQDLADLAEVNINTVVSVERGEGNPLLDTVITLANVLGMKVELK